VRVARLLLRQPQRGPRASLASEATWLLLGRVQPTCCHGCAGAVTCRWNVITPAASSQLPGVRTAHAATAKDCSIYVFGGWNGERELGDVFCFNTGELPIGTRVRVESQARATSLAPGSLPSRRVGH
jgi:hypothetical protein